MLELQIVFEDLRTFEGVVCNTFKKACIRRGLLEDDGVALQCLLEAEGYQMPTCLRDLFATILVFCEPLDVRQLWNKFWKTMAKDFSSHGITQEDILQSMVLQELDIKLCQSQKTISDFDLPPITCNTQFPAHVSPQIADELRIVTPDKDLACISNLNATQQHLYATIIQAIHAKQPVSFFIDGPGGTGKTFMYKALLAYVRVIIKGIAVATASSGITAVNLPGGRTAHSRFNIPFTLDEASICNITAQSPLAHLLRATDLFIWDEASMMTKYAFQALDRTMYDIIGKEGLFGGKIFVLGGDFRQILLVIPRGSRAQVVDSCLVSFYLWPSLKKIRLSHNTRALFDCSYSTFILSVGDGRESTTASDLIRIPDQMVVTDDSVEQGIMVLINAIYPDIEQMGLQTLWIIERAILASGNEEVDGINSDILNRFLGEEVVYYSYDSVKNDRYNLYSEDFLHKLTPNGFPLHELKLKHGCTVMLLRNLNPSMGLCNGTGLLCKDFAQNIITIEIISGQHSGNIVFIPRIPMLPSDNANIPIMFKRKQFPLKLAFALTINKAQGQIIPNTGVYLPEHVFTHGQLYVTLSRGTSHSGARIYIKGGTLLDHDGVYIRNIVCQEVLE